MTYDAFISYSHAADGPLARALQLGLQRLAKPWFRRPTIKIFRDQTSLSANPGLWSEIERSLGMCRHFILLASPGAAQSPWVDREVAWWTEHRPSDALFVVVTDGMLRWDAAAVDFDWTITNCLPASLKKRFAEEPLYVDLTWAKGDNDLSLRHSRFRGAVLDLAAPLHGRPKDELDSEDIRQHRRQRVATWSAVSTIVMLAIGALIAAWMAVQNADEAVRNAITATSRQHAMEAQLSVREGELANAVRSALTAWRTEDTAEARAAVFGTLEASWDIHAILRLHQSPVRAVAFRRDATELLTWSDDGMLVVWDVNGRRPLRAPVRGTPVKTTTAMFTPDGQSLITGGADGTIVVWDAATLREQRRLRDAQTSEVRSLALDPKGRLLAVGHGFEGAIEIWDLQQGQRLPIVLESSEQLSHDGSTTGVSFSADGRYLAAANQNPSALVAVWELPSGKLLARMSPSTSFWSNERVVFLTGERFGNNVNHLAIGASDGAVQLLRETPGSAERFQSISSTLQHQGSVVSMASGSGTLATGGGDGKVSMWSSVNDRAIVPVSWTKSPVESLAFSSDDSYLAAGSNDGTVTIYYGRLSRPRTLDDVLSRVDTSERSPDGKWIVTAVTPPNSFQPRLSIAHARTGRILIDADANPAIRSITFSRDSRWMMVRDDQQVALWEMSAEASVHEPARRWPASSASFSPLERFVVIEAPAKNGGTRLIDLRQSEIAERPLQASERGSVDRFSPDEAWLLTTAGTELRVWDTARVSQTGPPIALEPLSDDDDDDDRHYFEFSADSHWLIAGRRLGSAWLRRLAEPSAGGELTVSKFVNARFSPDGQWLAVRGSNQTEALWNLQALKRVFEAPTGVASVFTKNSDWFLRVTPNGRVESWSLRGSTPGSHLLELKNANANSIALSTDGRWMLVRSSDKHAGVWDLQNGTSPENVLSFDGVDDAEFSKDGRRILTVAERNGPMTIWDLATRQPQKVPVSLSRVRAFSTDGRLIAVEDFPAIAIVDLAAGRVVNRFVGHSKRLHGLAFTPNDGILGSVDANGTTILWDVTRARRLSDTLLGSGEDEELINRISFDARRLTLGGVPADPRSWIEDLCRRVDPGLSPERWSQMLGSVAYPWSCDTIEGLRQTDMVSRVR